MPCQSRQRPDNPQGFTLIELLVVIGVITVLIALLLPMMTRARQAAAQAQCAGNLRQWAIAVNMYADANAHWLPRRGQGKMPTQTITWYDDWFNELPPYLGQQPYMNLAAANALPPIGNNIWTCPEMVGPPSVYGNLFGYAMNMALSVREAGVPDRIEKVGVTSTMVFMTDGPAGYCSAVPFVSTPNAPAPFNPVARHHGKLNVSFLDGHVAAFDAAYIGINTAGDPTAPDACNRPDVRWYWYDPESPSAPWGGP